MPLPNNIEVDKEHHLADAFMPQTPLATTPERVSSPVSKHTFHHPPVSHWLRWAVQPQSAFKLLVIPIILYVQWEFLTPLLCSTLPNRVLECPTGSDILNPFAGFFMLSHPVPSSPPGDLRYAKGYWDLVFIAYNVVFWSFVRQVIAVSLAHRIGRAYGIRKQAKLVRFGEQFYSVIYWGAMGAWGYRIMGQLPTWWYRTEYLWIDYPHWAMKPELKRYYLMQASYWIHQLFVMVLGLERPRKDYAELVAHHIVTIWMIGWSYFVNLTYIGNAIYMSMDIPDTFLALAKTLNYLQKELPKSMAFALTLVSWTYFRLYLNANILWSVWYEWKLLPPNVDYWDFKRGVYLSPWMQYQVFIPILALLFLNIFWYFLILRIAYRALFKAQLDDDRSDDEGDGESKND